MKARGAPPSKLSGMVDIACGVNDERDAETGRFSEKYPADAFVDAIRELGGAASTQEVADEVGCPYQTGYSKLRALEDTGRVTSRKVANARLWRVDA